MGDYFFVSYIDKIHDFCFTGFFNKKIIDSDSSLCGFYIMESFEIPNRDGILHIKCKHFFVKVFCIFGITSTEECKGKSVKCIDIFWIFLEDQLIKIYSSLPIAYKCSLYGLIS